MTALTMMTNEAPVSLQQQETQQEMDPRVGYFLKHNFTVQCGTKKMLHELDQDLDCRKEKARAQFLALSKNRRTHYACRQADKFWLKCDFQYCSLQSDLLLHKIENPSNAWDTWAPIQALTSMFNKDQAKDIFKAADFKLLEKIGFGGFGCVYRAVHIPTGHVVALKEVDDASSLIETKDQRLLPLDCGVVPCYGTFRAVAQKKDPLKDNAELNTWLVLQYCANGALIDRVERCSLRRKEAAQIIKRLTKILIYLYENHGIVHNDIKLANILLDDDGSILLADLGVARKGHDQTERPGGTISYMAPEKIVDRKYRNGKYVSDSKIDVFSMGIMLCEMLFFMIPFDHKKAKAAPTIQHFDDDYDLKLQTRHLYDTMEEVYNHGLDIPNYVNREPLFKDFLHGLLAFQPEERLSLLEVKNHPWIKSHGKWSTRMVQQVRTGLGLDKKTKRESHHKTKAILTTPSVTATSTAQFVVFDADCDVVAAEC